MAFGNSAIKTNDLANVSSGSLKHHESVIEAELNNNRVKKRGGKTKHKLKKKVTAQGNLDLRLSTTDARTLPFVEWTHKLQGPARWCSENELRGHYEFGYSSLKVNQYVKRRLQKIIVLGIIAIFAAFFFLPMAVSSMKSNSLERGLLSIVIGAVFGFVFWMLETRKALNAYRNVLYQRQLVFIKFERLLIPYLAEMKNGTSLFSMLNRVSKRIDDPTDRALIQRLMASMAEGDSSAEPFVDFARRFGGSDSARLFMLSLYQMYNGNYSDAVVKDLGEQSNRQMMQQVDAITTRKLKRFNFLTTELTMAVVIVIFTYLACVIVNQIQQAFSAM